MKNHINIFVLSIVYLLIAWACELEEKEFIKPTPQVALATDITQTSFTAHWYPFVGAENYRIDIASDIDFKNIHPQYNNKLVTDTFLLTENLNAGTDYFYRVSYFRNNTLSSPSAPAQTQTLKFDKPIAQQAVDVTQTSFTAQWVAMPGSTGYTVELSTEPSFLDASKITKHETDENQLNLANLEVNQTYYYRVFAQSAASTSAPSAVISVTTTDLGKPQNLVASEIQFTSLKLNWEAVSGAESYLIDISEDPLFQTYLPNYKQKESPTYTETVTGLKANTLYYCRVRAKNKTATSEYSTVKSAQTQQITGPQSLWADEVSHQSALLSWHATPEAESYRLSLFHDMALTLPVTNWHEQATLDTSMLVTGLEAGQNYYAVVRAFGLNSVSDPTEPVLIKMLGLPVPELLAASEISDVSFAISWKAVDGVADYTVQLSDKANFSTVLRELNVSATNHVFLELKSNTSYFYRVKSLEGTSSSAFSETGNVSTLDIPAPKALEASSITPFGFTANWEVVPGVSEYLLQIASDDKFTDGLEEVTLSKNFYTIENLTPSKTYRYRVFSMKGGVVSQVPSNTIWVNTAPIPKPGTPVITEQTVFSFTATWDAVVEADYYQVTLGLDPEFKEIDSRYNWKNASLNSMKFTGLDHDKDYYLRVIARTDKAWSSWSDTVKIESIANRCRLQNTDAPWGERKYELDFDYNDDNLLERFTEDWSGSEDDRSYEVSYTEQNRVQQVTIYSNTNYTELLETWRAVRDNNGNLSAWIIRNKWGNMQRYMELQYTDDMLSGLINYTDQTKSTALDTTVFEQNWDNQIINILEGDEYTYKIRYDYRTESPMLNAFQLIDKDLAFFLNYSDGSNFPFTPLYPPASLTHNGTQMGIYWEAYDTSLPLLAIHSTYTRFTYNEGCPLRHDNNGALELK